MGDLGMGGKVVRQLHNGCDAGLIVRTEKRGAVGDDQLLSYVLCQLWELLWGESDVLLLIKYDLSALVVDDTWLDVPSGSIRRGVQVGYQADHRLILHPHGRDGSRDVAVIVHRCCEPHTLQLEAEEMRQIPLLIRGGSLLAHGVRRSLEGDVAEETLDDALLTYTHRDWSRGEQSVR